MYKNLPIWNSTINTNEVLNLNFKTQKKKKTQSSNSKKLLLEYLSKLCQIDEAIVIKLDLLEEVVSLRGPISHTQPWVQAKQEILSLVKRYGAIQVNKTK